MKEKSKAKNFKWATQCIHQIQWPRCVHVCVCWKDCVRMYVHVCACVIEITFNNKTHTHTHHIHTTLSMCMHILEVSNMGVYESWCPFSEILRQMYVNVIEYCIFEIFSNFAWILYKHLYQGDGYLISKWHLKFHLSKKIHNKCPKMPNKFRIFFHTIYQ